MGGHFFCFFVCYVEGSDILVGIHCLRNPLISGSEHMLPIPFNTTLYGHVVVVLMMCK